MGLRGPCKTPTVILQARGAVRGTDRVGEPEPDRTPPEPPDWLDEGALECWREIVPQLEAMKVIARCDQNIIARYCQLFSRYVKCERWIAAHGMIRPMKIEDGITVGGDEWPQVYRASKVHEQLMSIERVLGLTPGARANMAREQINPDENRGKNITERYFA